LQVPRKLKVFRTPTGFHDAYVAAPSRKAALEAWGADVDLFARGAAEQVTDPRLTTEALAHPGKVIRISRGDLQAQLKAIGSRKKPAAKKTGKASEAKPEPKPAKRKPPPSRSKVDQAEAALDQARRKQAGERAALEKQRDAIERKLDALDARHDKEIARLEKRFEKARAAYRAALGKWSG
jgi:hypothetical protein